MDITVKNIKREDGKIIVTAEDPDGKDFEAIKIPYTQEINTVIHIAVTPEAIDDIIDLINSKIK